MGLAHRAAFKIFAPKEAKEAMNILKGKRTLLGLLITQIPEVWNAIAPLLGGLGMSAELEAGTKIVGGIVAVLGFVLKFAPEDPKPSPAVVLLILLCILPSLASAQDPAPSPRPEASLSCGAMRFVERGAADSEDFVCRASLAVPAPSGLTLFARADYSRTQEVPAGESLSLDIKTFRSIEGFAGARKDIAPNLSATAFAGVTWNRDRTIEPTDPRLWTVAGGLRYTVPGRGHVVAAAGHHGPVGGTAFLGSVVYDLGENAAWFGDVAVPLGASRFALKPYTVRFGVSARLRSWKF